MRSGLAIGEVQVLLNSHVGSGGRGVSPGSPGQWTVVTITWGWGLVNMQVHCIPGWIPVSFQTSLSPPSIAWNTEFRCPVLELDCSPGSPGQWTVVAITLGVGAVCGDTRGKPHPGPDNLPEQTDRALTGKDQDRSPRRWTI